MCRQLSCGVRARSEREGLRRLRASERARAVRRDTCRRRARARRARYAAAPTRAPPRRRAATSLRSHGVSCRHRSSTTSGSASMFSPPAHGEHTLRCSPTPLQFTFRCRVYSSPRHRRWFAGTPPPDAPAPRLRVELLMPLTLRAAPPRGAASPSPLTLRPCSVPPERQRTPAVDAAAPGTSGFPYPPPPWPLDWKRPPHTFLACALRNGYTPHHDRGPAPRGPRDACR